MQDRAKVDTAISSALQRPAPATWFVVIEGGKARGGGTLEEMLESNREDEDLCEWLQRAKTGDTICSGGGAAPRVQVRKVL